jgi:hypothetical protein
LNGPSGVAVDSAGNVYIGDFANCLIRKISTNGDISTAAGIPPVNGNAQCGYNGDNQSATSAELDGPIGVAVDSLGDLFIADSLNNRIREVLASTGVISTVAGNGTCGLGSKGPATAATLCSPTGVVVDSLGDIYIADSGEHAVQEVTAGMIRVLSIPGLNTPVAVALDRLDNLYVSDDGNDVIYQVATSGYTAIVAGMSGSPGYSGDGGPATQAQLNFPIGVATDAAGEIYIADEGNGRVRRVDIDGVIGTLAGNGTACANPTAIPPCGDGAPAPSANFTYTFGVAIDSSGNLYVTDPSEERLRFVAGAGDPYPLLHIPGALHFPSVPIGDSLTRPLQVQNLGESAMSVVTADTTGDFSVSGKPICQTMPDDCMSCMISVTFTPTTTGLRTGTLMIYSNAYNNPAVVALSGYGEAAGTPSAPVAGPR